MKNFINFLPTWVETNLQPAFYDKESGTVIQQTARMYAKVNQLIRHFNDLSKETKATIEEYIAKFVELKDFVDNYFDNLDVQEEINNKLDEMAEDGTLQSLIYEAINVPQGMTLDARRIGRKLFYSGEGVDASPYNMQGGCRIDDTYVAYALWDSLNKYPVSNRIVIMNINTGEIVRYADYSYGWCNSMTYYDGKLYIAERGKEIDAEGHTENNGVIKVLNASTLALVETITMDFNINALYQYEGKFYILQEGTNNIYKYNSSLSELESTIELDIDYVNYHQTICVDGQYIYLLSTKPSNALNIFDVETGDRVRSYNIAKYGGTYRIGELQWIDKIDDNGNIIIGSNIFSYNECIAQFFLLNYKKNVDSKNFDSINAQTLQCNSEADYYNPDGIDYAFTSINEAINTSISNMVIEGNDKSYPYVYASDIRFCRIKNATLSEGGVFQYGNYDLVDCVVNACIQPSHNTNALFVRRSNIFFQRVEFDTTSDYCIHDEGECFIKFSVPTFTNYGVSVFKTNHPTSEIFLNNANNIPYMPRAYEAKYNLTSDASLTAYASGDYLWSSYNSYSESQIKELIDNCGYFEVEFIGLNKDTRQKIVLQNKKDENATYTITDFVISSSVTDERLAKMIFKITKSKLQITSSVCQRDTGTGIAMVENPTQYQLIQIKNIRFFDDRS